MTSPTATETVEAVQSPALTLAKVGLPVSFAAAGVSITYTYTITNSGNVTVDGPFTVVDDKTTVDCSGAALVLAPGGSTSCTSTYVTSQADVDAGFVTNVASGSGLDPNGDPVTSPTATETVEAVQSPALTLAKAGLPVSFAAAGVSITYTYTITNSGNVTISGPFTVADDKTTVDCSGAALSLAPTASTTCTSTYVTSQADVDNGGVTNVASGSGLDPNGDPVTSPTATETVEAVQGAALTLTKVGDPVSFAAAGVSITYTYTITNSGNVTISGPFTVVDDKTTVDCSGAALVLAPTASTTCTSTYVTSQADVDNGGVTNVASGSGLDPNGDPVTSPTATETVEAVQSPALTLAKAGLPVSFAAAGVSITYTYTITNSGNVTIDGPFTVVDDKTTVDCSGAALVLAPGGSTTCTSTYVTLQADVDAGFVTNIAAVTGTDPNGDPVTSPDATETVEAVQGAALTLAKAGLPVSFAAAGVSITYTYTITNAGNVTISGPFTVVDDKTLVDCSGAAALVLPGGSTTCTSTYVTLQADVDAGFVTNVASGSGLDPNGDPVTSPTATETVEAVQSPALTLAKAGLPVSFAAAGVSITYTYTITNSGNVTVDGPLTVVDDKTTVDCSGAALSLLPTASTTCTSTYVTSQADVDNGGVTNVASGSGLDPNGDPVTSPTATETVEAVQSPALTLAKAGLPVSFAAAGVSITYTYTITNSGNVTISGPFTVADDKTTVDCSGAALSLAPTASTTCTSTYVTSQADVDNGGVTNVASGSGLDPNGDPVTSPTATETVEAVQGAALTLTKVGDPVSFAAAGVSITYTYTITNSGNVTVDGPLTVVDDKTTVDCSGAALSLLPTASTTCTSTYVTSQADVDNGGVTNVASGSGLDPNGDPVTSPTATETVEAVQSPALTLAKAGLPVSFAAAGVSITYTYTITNSGNVTISGPFTVADDKTTVDCSGAALSLAPTASTTCTSTYVTSQADVDNGGVTNVASGSGLDPNGDPVTSLTATETVEAVQGAALTLTKVGDPVSFAAAGVSITYTYTITNSGNVTISGPFTVVDDKTTVDCSGAAALVLPGGSTSCTSTYVTSQADVDNGGVTNVASGSGLDPNGDPVTSPTATETVEAVQSPALTLAKAGLPVSFSAAGVSITYTYTITNSGNVTISGPFTVADDKTTVDCSGAALVLAPGGSTTCTSTYVTSQADVDNGGVTNVASGSGLDPNGDPVTSLTATETVEAVQGAALTLAKAGLPVSFAAAGVSITYTYTITNSGNVTVDGPFTVVDDKTTVDCSGAAALVLPGGSTSCTSTYVTLQADVDNGGVTNVASGLGLDPNGDPVTSPTATETVEAVQSPALTLTKAGDPASFAAAGVSITYTYTITNSGNVTIDGPFTVVDDKTTVDCSGAALVLAPGGSTSCTSTYVTSQADVDNGGVTNIASGSGLDPNGDPVTSPTATETVEAVQSPALTLTKAGLPVSFAAAGVSITYTYTITNSGNVTIDGPFTVADDKTLVDCSAAAALLLPTASTSCTSTYVTSQADVDAGFVTNIASGSGLDPNGDPVTSPTATETVEAIQSPVLGLAKSGGPAYQAVGDPVSYTYTLSNDGNVTLSAPYTVDDDKTTVTCSSTADLAPGASTTCTATYNVTQADIDAGQVTNVATAAAVDPNADPVLSAQATATVDADLNADLAIVKTVTSGATTHVPGTPISYTLTVTNHGPSVTTTTTVTDALPADVGFVSATPSNAGSCTEIVGVITCELGSLAIDETVTIVVVGDVDPASTATLTNTAQVASNLPDGVPGNDVSSVSTTAAPSADVRIDKVAPATYVPGDLLTYTLTVVNDGPSVATAVTVTDNLPAGTLFQSAASSAACSESAGTVTCGPVDLIVSGSATYTVVVDTASSLTTALANTAAVTSSVPDPDTADNIDSATSTATPQANLVLTKSGPIAPVAAGEQFDFTIDVLNNGPSDAVAVNVSDVLPAGLTYVTSSVSGGSGTELCTSAISCSLGTVVAGVTETITIRVEVGAIVTGDVTNTATATTSTPGDVLADSTDDHTVTVVEVSDVSITKVDSVDPVVAGTQLTYTIEIVNAGPSQATNVVISDPLPAGTSFVAAAGCAAALGTVTCNVTALPVGVPATFDITVLVAASAPDGSTLVNTATVTTASDNNAANDSALEATDVVAVADLVTTKTSTPNPFVPGQPMTYTISVVNVGPSDAQAVVLIDALPAGFTPITISPTPTCALAGSDLTCNLATLAAQDDLVVTVFGITSAASTGFTNTATVSSSTTDPVPANNTDTDVNDGNPLADLIVSKADSVDPVVAGAPLTYTITVTNNGPSDAQNVSVADTPPVGFTVASVDRAECNLTISCTFPLIASGDSVTIAVSGTVDSGVTDTGNPSTPELSNTVTVSSSTPDPVAANNTATETSDVVELANVLLTKVEPGTPIVPGGQRVYTIAVANAGPSDADNVVVTDTLPPGLTFASATGATCSASGATVTCNLGTLVAADPVTAIQITADVDPSVTGTVTNAATATSTTPDPNPADNADTSSSVTSPAADLDVSKVDLADPVLAGAQIAYQISGRNSGPSTATNVAVVDTLPVGVSFASASLTIGSGSCGVAAGVITCSLGTLAPGAIFAIDVLVDVDPSVPDATVLTNAVAISSTTPDPTSANNSDTEDTTVGTSADVGVTKVAAFPAATPGQNVSYQLVVTNVGPSDALGVVITDALPTGLTNVVVTGATCAGTTTLVCPLGTLAPGAAVPITVTADIDPALVGNLVNSVTVTTTTPDPNPANDTATTAIPLAPAADLSIVKTGPATVIAGQLMTYTLLITNAGPSDALNAVVSDTLPAGVSLVSATVGSGSGACIGTSCVFPTIPAGTNATVVVIVDVASSVVDATALVNTASVTSVTPDPDTADNTDTAVAQVDTEADVSIVKSVGPDPFVPGTPVTYTLTVQNAGPSDALAVVVGDPVPTGLTITSANSSAGSCSFDVAAVTCSLGTLADGGLVTITIGATTGPSLVNPVVNTATVISTTTDPDPTDNSSTAVATPIPTADLQVTKSSTATAVVAGGSISYDVVITNAGASTAVAVELADVLPAQLVYVSHTVTSPVGSCVYQPIGTTVRCTAPVLLPGQSISLTLTATVDPSTPTGSSIANTATGTSATPDPAPSDNGATVTTPVTSVADLVVAKALTSGPLVPGSAEQYQIVISNAGPSDAQNVSLADAVPAGLTVTGVITSAGTCSHDGTTVTCTVATVAAGGSVTITVDVLVAADVTGDVINTAGATTTTTDPNPANNTGTATVTATPSADLALTKATITNPVVPGRTVTYVVSVSNGGPSDAANVQVVDTLPVGLAADSAAPGQGTCVAAGVNVSCLLGAVPAGQSVNITIVATVDAGLTGSITNTATVTASTDDPNSGNDTASVTDDVVPSADLSIAKTVSVDPFVPGTPIAYTLIVSNEGPSTAVAVVATDTLPAGLTATSASATSGSCGIAAQVVTCTIPTLVPGGSVSITIGVGTSSTLTSTVDNAASVTTETPDPDTSNNTAAVTSTAAPAADVSIVKSAPAVSTGGDSISYQIVVTNSGPSAAVAVWVVDTLPSTLTFVSASSGCTTSAATVTCSVGDMAPAATRTIVIEATIATVIGTVSVVNTAAATTSTPDPDSADNTSTVTTLVSADPGALTGRVWNDADRDGVIEPGETGFGGVTVVITGDPDGDGIIDRITVVTNPDGTYSTALPPGNWTVAIDVATLPFGTDATTPNAASVTVAPNGRSTADFGRAFGTVTGRVWLDADGDGVLDQGEVDIAGVRVIATCPGRDGLLGTADDVTGSAVTASPYSIGGLPVGQTCTIRLDLSSLPQSIRQSFDPDGVLDGATALVIVGDGNVGINFGYRSEKEVPTTGSDTVTLVRLASTMLGVGVTLALFGARRRRSRSGVT